MAVIDTATDTLLSTIAVDPGAFAIAVQPDGERIFVGGNDANELLVIDAVTESIVARVPVGETTMGIAVNSDGSRIYVANEDTDDVTVVDGITLTAMTTVAVGNGPWGLVVLPADDFVYVGSTSGQDLTVIEASTNTPTATIPLTGFFGEIGVDRNSDGSRVFASSGNAGGDGFLDVIDTSSNTVITTYSIGDDPVGVAVHPNDQLIYIGHEESPSLSIVDLSSGTVTLIELSSSGVIEGLDVHPDGSRLYAADFSNEVFVLDTSTNTVLRRIATPTQPTGFGSFIPVLKVPVELQAFSVD